MENCKAFECRFNFLICFSIGTLFLLLIGHAKAENKSAPLTNVNLSPYWQWRSAYECMLLQYNWTANTCSAKDILTLTGKVDVAQDELKNYCQPDGCRKYISKTLDCIHAVKRDFWFANNASVKDLNNTINQGCDNYTAIITGNYTKSSGMRIYQKLFVSLAIPTMVLTTII